MRVNRAFSCALVAVSLLLPGGIAGAAEKSKTKARKKTAAAPVPARPTGKAPAQDPNLDAYYGGPKLDTITEYTNELGQTVYSIAASHFDISRPLRDLAATAIADREEREENEPPSNPQLPAARIIRSELPDPVVQPVVEAGDASMLSGVPLAAPTTGFNFLGVGVNGGSPSDCNGSVGGNQFVETVNVQYQIWTLNRSTQVATPVFPTPLPIKTLWSGFGGACEAQNSGDPIVIFDKTAKRWLISQFTSSAAAGVYYQCVAVSTTADATGTYARWAFAVPSGKFGDYPHISAWPNAAYFMMAHGFGGTFTALFAAMDRNKMVAGNPTATWVVIQDPNEGGHMPADMDGFALPPTTAPGVFVSLHGDGMYIYRMKVNFVSPGASSKTLQAIVPIAPANAACGGGTCIPQPGAGSLDALSDRLMFRAAYRNFIDHESLVVSHAVDPSVSGLVSGVRWYDIRLSGTPNATCPTYPCMYQQGTIADVPGGRNRWMSSLAMDTAENILVGYSTSGKTDGIENHSSRYTARAKADPPGTMTAPEATIVTGTANNTAHSRWGDYFSMSSDPADDCTFWFVSQYYTATNAWSTRIASAAFPAGSGPGQCPVTTCVTRPALQPSALSATTPANNQITVSWTGITPTPGAYDVERADGACNGDGLYRPLAATPGTTTSYADTTVQGGLVYSYRVRSAADAAGKCQAILASPCVSTTATGNCTLKPSFQGLTSIASSAGGNCGVTMSWAPASSSCPLAPSVRYNIYRGTVPDFVPSAANRIATCVVGTSYLDTDNLSSGTTYYYVIHAEDGTTGNGGACGGGNEDASAFLPVPATPYAAGVQAAPGTWTDGGGDNSAQLKFGVTVQTNNEIAFRFVRTADDAGANHTPGGAHAYRNAGPGPGNTYSVYSCADLQTPDLTVGASGINLQYWERHQIEYHWDGLTVDYSVNGGPWIEAPAPSNNAILGCDPSDDTTGWEPLSCSDTNACGFPITKNAFSGPLGGGSSCGDYATSGAVTPYAHRCHPITGLNPGDTIRFRWQFSSDQGAEFAGFYLDDVGVTGVRLPNACVPDTCAGQSNGTSCNDGSACTTVDSCTGGTCFGGSALGCDDTNDCTADGCDPASGCFHTNTTSACDDGNACTSGDACGAGICSGTPDPPPGELQNARFTSPTTFVWDTQPNSPTYDIVRGALSALPVGPGGGDEVCFNDQLTAVLTDATVPAPGTGFWYVIRAATLCGTGGFGTQHDGTPRVTTTCP
jgi:hypothetical protein